MHYASVVQCQEQRARGQPNKTVTLDRGRGGDYERNSSLDRCRAANDGAGVDRDKGLMVETSRDLLAGNMTDRRM